MPRLFGTVLAVLALSAAGVLGASTAESRCKKAIEIQKWVLEQYAQPSAAVGELLGEFMASMVSSLQRLSVLQVCSMLFVVMLK